MSNKHFYFQSFGLVILLGAVLHLYDVIVVKDNVVVHSLPQNQTTILTNSSSTQSSSAFQSCDAFNFTEPANCAKSKCFLQLNQPPTEGYLLYHNNGKCCANVTTIMTRMTVAYELAKDLEDKFQIKHPLLGPPQQLDPNHQVIPLCVQEQLSDTANFKSVRVMSAFRNAEFHVDISSGTVYQRNRVIPTPHFLIKVVKLFDPIDFIYDHVHNGTEFLQNFEPDVKRVFDVLKYEPRLFSDFQAVLVGSGEIYHLDFDRNFVGREGFEEKKVTDDKKKKYSMLLFDFFNHIKSLVKLKEKGMLDKYVEENYDDNGYVDDEDEEDTKTENNDKI